MSAPAMTMVVLPSLPPGKKWPPHMLAEGRVKVMLRETYARIASGVAADQALARETRLALEWCRANGNPHLASLPPAPIDTTLNEEPNP